MKRFFIFIPIFNKEVKMNSRSIAFSVALLTTFSTFGQSDSTATNVEIPMTYDPTQFYTSLHTSVGVGKELYAGYYGNSDDIAYWYGGELFVQLEIEANIKLSDKFSFNITLPISSYEEKNSLSLFDNVNLGVNYQIHNNTGIFNSSLIGINLTSPIVGDASLRTASLIDAAPLSYRYSIIYTAGINISNWFKVYPSIGYMSGHVEPNIYMHYPDSTFVPSRISKRVFVSRLRTSILLSRSLFLQFTGQYEYGRMAYSNGTFSVAYNSENHRNHRLNVIGRIQYIYSKRSQWHLLVDVNNLKLESDLIQNRNPITRQMSVQIGYNMFL